MFTGGIFGHGLWNADFIESASSQAICQRRLQAAGLSALCGKGAERLQMLLNRPEAQRWVLTAMDCIPSLLVPWDLYSCQEPLPF